MSKEFKIGIIALLSGLILYFGFNYLKGQDFFVQSNPYYAIYNDIKTLEKSNLVKVNGFPVGKVDRIELIQKDEVSLLVAFDVKDEVQMGTGTVAELTQDLFGVTNINLILDLQNPVLSKGDTLKSTIDQGLMGTIETTLSSIEYFVGNSNSLIDSIKLKLINFDSALYILVNSDTSIVKNTMKDLTATFKKLSNSVASNLDALSSDIEKAITSTNSKVDSLNVAEINRSIENLTVTMESLSSLTKEINNGKGTVGKLLKDEELYESILKTMRDMDSLALHLNNYPRDFLKPFGRKHKDQKGI